MTKMAGWACVGVLLLLGMIDVARGGYRSDDVLRSSDYKSIYDAAKDYGANTFIEAVQAANFVDKLSDPNLLATAFVPDDQAFADAFDALKITKQQLFQDKDRLSRILSYHIVPDATLRKKDLQDGNHYKTLLDNEELRIETTTLNIYIHGNQNKAGIRYGKADIQGGKGEIHIIDNVLLP